MGGVRFNFFWGGGCVIEKKCVSLWSVIDQQKIVVMNGSALTLKGAILSALREDEHGAKEAFVSNLQNYLQSQHGVSSSRKDVVDEFERLGLVGVFQKGYNAVGEERFEITDFGREYRDIYLSFENTKQGYIDIQNRLGIS